MTRAGSCLGNGAEQMSDAVAAKVLSTKQCRDECLTSTGRRHVKLALPMKEDLDTVADACEADDVSGEANAHAPGPARFEPSMKDRVAPVGSHHEALALRPVGCSHARVHVGRRSRLVEEPGIEPVAADDQAESFGEIGVAGRSAGD